MKKLYLICIVLIGVICIFNPIYFVSAEDMDELYDKKNELNTKIEESNNQLSSVKDNINGVMTQISKLNGQIAKYQESVNDSNLKLVQAKNNLEKVKNELLQAEKMYDHQKNLLDKRMVAIYESGDTIYLDVLLSSKNIEEFLSKFYYLTKIAEYDQNLLKIVTNAKEEMTNKKVLMEKEYEKYKVEKEYNEKLLFTLENTKVIRNSYLKELNGKEKELQEQIQLYEDEMEKLEKKIMEVALMNIGDEYIGGELAWPVPGYNTVTSPFGMRKHPIFGVYRMHTGVDIGAPLGREIIAANDGVVTLATYSSSYGNYVMVEHGGGVVTLYAHGSKICVEEGQEVKKGDIIMLIGSTGWSTGPHLHFEVRLNGQTCDPLPYITSNKMISNIDMIKNADKDKEDNENKINNENVVIN